MPQARPRKKLRRGYTTGTCAAAAAKAACLMLLQGRAPTKVSVTLPRGDNLVLTVERCEPAGGGAVASVIKDAGDDPDVTHGAEVGAVVRPLEPPAEGECVTLELEGGGKLYLAAGAGVGHATKPGLAVPPGEPAINPVPRRMIARAVEEALAAVGRAPSRLSMEIFVVGGEELARRTLNARLGIVGGLSILGTTGIVEPVSRRAYRDTIDAALDVAAASPAPRVVLAPGRTSERYALSLYDLPEENFVLAGDHMGYALERAGRRAGIGAVTLAGQFAKLLKLARGDWQTHCAHSRPDLVFLSHLAEEAGLPRARAGALAACHTAREAAERLAEWGAKGVFQALCETVRRGAEDRAAKPLPVECVLFSYRGEVWGRCDG